MRIWLVLRNRIRLAAGLAGGNRQLVDSVLRRGDEPGEMLAYWTSRYGRAVPQPVKRGVADAVALLYDERAFLRWAITARHGRDEAVPESLRVVGARAALGRLCPAARHEMARGALGGDEEKRQLLDRAAAGQWEWLLSWVGDAPAEDALPKADQWRLILLIDTSASMGQPLSRKSAMTMVQAAALFGLATAIRNGDRNDLYGFADGQFRVERSAYGQSVLRSVEAFSRRIGEVGHGTRIAEAVRATYHGHDRVLIFTDMQTFPERSGWGGHVGDVSASVPAQTPVYGFNLVGYQHSAVPAGHGNRRELGGLADATFSQIPNIEAGLAAGWPWAQRQVVQ